MATGQMAMRLDNNPLKLNSDIPRIDLAKIDNIAYYIESWHFFVDLTKKFIQTLIIIS